MLSDSFPTKYIGTIEILSVLIIYRICHQECDINPIRSAGGGGGGVFRDSLSFFAIDLRDFELIL